MIKIPLNDLIIKIKENANIPEEEINKKIDEKLEQLSGLVSKEGAAHIVANELGVKLFEATSGRLQIKNILSGMRNVETVGRVRNVFSLNEFQRKEGGTGKVCSFIAGDETGTIRIVGWGDQAENVAKLKENDIVKIVGGYVRENNDQKEVHLNDKAQLIINPPGETVSEIKEQVTINRKQIKDLKENDTDVEILATIVQAFEPRFFEVCPSCGKRARQKEGSFVCDTHGKVNPDNAYVMNLFLDDGTENMSAVFFRKQMEILLNMAPDQIVQFKENPQNFEEVKSKLLGEQVKLIGKVNKNEMFDRLEFLAQRVDTNPDPAKEIERLENQEEKTEEEFVKEEVEKIN